MCVLGLTLVVSLVVKGNILDLETAGVVMVFGDEVLVWFDWFIIL